MRTIDLSGKAALVTGGTRNIGRAIAQSLAEAGLIHFAAMLAQDVGPRAVRVNVVSPGFTDTDHAPEADKPHAIARAALRRLGTPEDIAGAVLFFASDLSAFITGQWLRVNGGAV